MTRQRTKQEPLEGAGAGELSWPQTRDLGTVRGSYRGVSPRGRLRAAILEDVATCLEHRENERDPFDGA